MTTPARPTNPPAQPELAFRLAAQPQLAAWMRGLIAQQPPVPDMARLDMDDPQGFVPALLDAWAAVGDVLSFYQERIVNEGFLRTATEAYSVRQLVAAVGYAPQPALSAWTWLAFSLLEASATTQMVIPSGTAVQSVPLPGQTPVLFETTEDIEARPAWNTLAPLLPEPRPVPQIVQGTTQLRVTGPASGVRAGTVVLFGGVPPQGGDEVVLVRRLSTVETNPATLTTLLEWDDALAQDPPGLPGNPIMASAEAVTFRQTARLLGATAPDWNKLSPTVQAQLGQRRGDVALAPFAENANDGLPAEGIGALAVDDHGTVFAAAADRILRRMAGAGWQAAGQMPTRSKVTALLATADGLFAGTARGEVFRSLDQGDNWFALAGPLGLPKAPPTDKRQGPATRTLPAVPVEMLAVLPGPDRLNRVVAGTAQGLWQSPANGGNWAPCNDGLPGHDSVTGFAAARIAALVVVPGGNTLLLATDHGLFKAASLGAAWSAVALGDTGATPGVIRTAIDRVFSSAPPPAAAPPAVRCLLAAPQPSGAAHLWAGTTAGVFRSADGGLGWALVSPIIATSLARHGTDLLAGTADGLVRSSDGDTAWTAEPGLFAQQAVAVLAVGADAVIAAAPFGGYAPPPPGAAEATEIHLNDVYPSLVADGWIVLTQDKPQPATLGCRIKSCEVVAAAAVPGRAFPASGRVTKIVVDRPIGGFDPKTTTVFLSSQSHPLQQPKRTDALVLTGQCLLSGPESQPQSIQLDGAVEDLAQRHISVSGRRAKARLVGRAGSVRRLAADGVHWQTMGSGNHNTRALIVARGTDGPHLVLGGIIDVRRFDGTDWRTFGRLRRVTQALAQGPDSAILAGTENGIWRRAEQDGDDWTNLGIKDDPAVFALLIDADGRVLAGTAHGLWIAPYGTASLAWTTVDIIGPACVTALARTGPVVAAGTDDGRLFIERDGVWQAVTPPPAVRLINDLAFADSGRLYAATNLGLFTSDDDGTHWSLDATATGDIRAVALGPDKAVWAARHGQGVLRDGRLLVSGIANDVSAFAFLDGEVYIGSLFQSVLRPAQADAPPLAGGSEFTEPTWVTQFEDPDLGAQLAEGPVSDKLRASFAAQNIVLPPNAAVQVLPGEANWSIGDAAANSVYMLYGMGAIPTSAHREPPVYRLFLETDLDIIAPPQTRPDGFQQWHLRGRTGIDVALIGAPGEIDYRPSDPAGETIAEIGRIADAHIADDRSRTTLLLEQSLQQVYDAATVSFNANVAPASHGETPIQYEVLGSGDNRVPTQCFPLKRQPVTALAIDADPFYRFAAQVRVRASSSQEPLAMSGQLRPRDLEQEAVLWRQVASLANSGPNDADYMLVTDETGKVSACFGDGIHGRRLPTGTENVVAQYRVGAGTSGNVDAGRLTSLRKRPPGVRRVTNPVAATGGTAGEACDDVRSRAAIPLRACHRVVSWGDYADFVRAYPGVAKVAVADIARGGQRVVHVTVAEWNDADDAPGVLRPPPSFEELRQTLRDNAAMPRPLRIDHYQPVWFDLAARLDIDPDFTGAGVLDAVRALLLDRYGFKQRALGEAVRAAEIVAAIQNVAGVRAVSLTALHRHDERPALTHNLPAALAQPFGADGFAAAELLLVNPSRNSPLQTSNQPDGIALAINEAAP